MNIDEKINSCYPPILRENQFFVPFNVLIGVRDTLAVDVAGTRISCLNINEVPHLRTVYERGLGEGVINKIKVIGEKFE